jgi:uncharacterized repeat protein (TIGR01451 family)
MSTAKVHCRYEYIGTILMAFLVAMLMTGPAWATDPTSATSSAYGEQVQLSLLPLLGKTLTASSGPSPTATGSAPPSYNQQGTLANANVAGPTGVGTFLTTGVITVAADSQVPAADQVHGRAEVNNAALSAVGLLSLGAGEISSDASITGTCGTSLTPAGVTQITGATLGGLVGAHASIDPSPAANSVVVNLLGVKIIANEQVISGDGINNESISVNALHITLDNSVLSLVGALTGDVVIGHSQASLVCGSAAPVSADLSVTVTPNTPVGTIGVDFRYNITVSNAGPVSTGGVVLTDSLPTGVTLVSAIPSQGTCSGTTSITCALGTLTAGGDSTVAISVLPTSTDPQVNVATVTGDAPDPDPSNNTVMTTTGINPLPGGPTADLTIVCTQTPNPDIVGSPITYSCTVTNHGPDDAPGVQIVDTLPAGVSLVSASSSQGDCSGSTIITCGLGTVKNGGTATITIIGNPTQTGTIIDQVVVSSGATDPNPSGNTVTITTTINPVATIPCSPSATILCIDDQPGDKRFAVSVGFNTVQGTKHSGFGHPAALTVSDTTHGGLFWFFDSFNPEMMIKVLNACSTNHKFWVFYSAGTNVGLTTTVTDTETGTTKVYTNTDLIPAPPLEDTQAFSCTDADNKAAAAPSAAKPVPPTPPLLADSTRPQSTSCVTGSGTLCIAGRFLVAVTYSTSQNGGKHGAGTPVDISDLGFDRGGVFWFFDASNPEMLIKVLDACALEGTYWVFYSATTNVGLTVTVTDTVTGNVSVFANRDLTPAPVTLDTRALSCN